MNPVQIHFNNASSEYSKHSNRGLWNLLRKNEAKAISALLPDITISTSVLDLGCGSGFYSDILHQLNVKNINCVDFSENMLSQIKNPAFKKIQANIEEFKTEQKYDIIICAGAMEFTNNPEKIFKNISSMLSQEGCFILLFPTKNFFGFLYKFYHQKHKISVKLFCKKEIHTFMKNSGLKSVAANTIFPFSKIEKFVHE